MLEKGSLSNPTGNLVVYCKVIGENPFEAGCEYIASNVIVSYLKVGENLPVVTFPPISFPNLEDLQSVLVKYGDLYDIAKLPDFIMPTGKEASQRYLQERMEQYNQFVLRYVEFCKNREIHKEQKKKFGEVHDFLNELVEFSVQYRSSKGLAREIAKSKVDSLAKEISTRFPAFDMENYMNAIYRYKGQKGDELATLYLKKFHAIHHEEYEKASLLKRRIHELETSPI
jgi:hypothetical protein